MIEVEISLRPCRGPQGLAVAGVVPGADPARWRAVLDELGAAGERLRLLPLPARRGETACGGVLLFSPELVTLPPVANLQRYRLVHGRLLIPAEAELTVELLVKEVSSLFPYPWQVLHPALGLIGFESGDLLGSRELVAAGRQLRQADWGRARPGVAVVPPPRRILLDAKPVVEKVLEEVKDDIASDDPSSLPGHAAEPGRARRTTLAAREWILRRLLALLNRLPAGPQTENWIDRLARRLAGSVQEIVANRELEMQRLLKMFEAAPDEALKHAVPLSTQADHRGRAPATGRLRENHPDFDLYRLGGQRSGGNWTVDAKTYLTLQSRYRAAANRELALGRFGRAAYIFAHLLNDFHGAANALRQGGRYREAAVLLVERLKAPRLAAECLEAGGLLVEAAELFAREGLLERAGNLFREAGDEERATRHFERAVAASSSPVARARLLFDKLSRPEEALAVVGAGWPGGAEAPACQLAEFRYRQRLDDEPGVHRLLRRLARREERLESPVEQVEVLRQVSTEMGDTTVRRWARDLAIGMIGESLQGACPEGERSRLLDQLPRLVPQDRQLARDVSSFRTRQAEMRRRPVRVGRAIALEPLARFKTGSACDWHGTAPIPEGLLAWGRDPRGDWACVEAYWSGATRWITWKRDRAAPTTARLRGLFHPGGQHLIIAPSAGPPLAEQTFFHQAGFFSRRTAGTPGWWPSEVAGVGEFDYQTLSLIRQAQDALLVTTYSPAGNLLREVPFGSGSIAPGTRSWMFSRDGTHFLVLGSMAVALSGEAATSAQVNFDSPVQAVSASRPHQVLRLAVSTLGGTRLFFPKEKWRMIELGRRLGEGPVHSAFLANGCLVLLDGAEGRVFRSTAGGEPIARFALPDGGGGAAGIVPALLAGRPGFGVLLGSGEVVVYPAVE